MTDRPIIFFGLIAAYVTAAVLTFGHAAANADCENIPKYRNCKEYAAFSGIFAAPFWPLYWSWVVFEQPSAEGGAA